MAADAWSDRRIAILRQRYANGDSLEVIASKLNYLPGPAMTVLDVSYMAGQLGLRRPDFSEMIRQWIEMNGVTLCPTAAVAHTTAEVDIMPGRREMAAHIERRELDIIAGFSNRSQRTMANRRAAREKVIEHFRALNSGSLHKEATEAGEAEGGTRRQESGNRAAPGSKRRRVRAKGPEEGGQ